MDLRQLRYFVATVDERSFSRAAVALHVVQSSISAAVKGLEDELDTSLILRSARTFQLTPAGEELVPRARALLEAEREARDAVAGVSGRVSGTLRIGTMTSAIPFDIPALLGRYHLRFPLVDIQLTASSSGSQGLTEALLGGRLDLTFASLMDAGHPRLRLHQVGSTPIDLVVPADHRLSGRRMVALRDIPPDPFIDFPLGYGLRTLTDRAFERAGIPRHVAVEVTNPETGADFVRHGLGIALLPRFAVPPREDLVRIPLSGDELEWTVSLAVRVAPAPSNAAAALLGMLGTQD
ncbi:MAG: putative LysR-family transcriptional regulator [Microbacteriaceae bacterium]|nr:putative LysR-family transcriptional regulator [Microbacteriaceae bacterium]